MKKSLLLFLVAVTLLACGGDVATHKIKRATADMDRMFADAAKARKFAGSVLIARDGVVYLRKGYGQADGEKRVPCTPRTKYRLASITKQFTAMAILLLEARGALRVQDAIADYVSPCPAAWKGITIHHLLTHTSGIPDLPTSPTVSQTIALLREKPLDFPPGSKWNYSNSGYILLGAIIEKAAGVPYEEFLRKQIFIPTGMTSTGYDHGGEDVAVSYESSGVKADSSAMPSFFSAGALYSTAEDLSRWDQALSTDALIPMPSIDTMFTPHASFFDEGENHVSYGYGWMLASISGRMSQFHFGVSPGISTVIARFPKDKVTIIILSNMSTTIEDYEQKVEDAILGKLPKAP